MAVIPNGIETLRKISDFSRLSRVHERYRQTTDRRTNRRWHITWTWVQFANNIWQIYVRGARSRLSLRAPREHDPALYLSGMREIRMGSWWTDPMSLRPMRWTFWPVRPHMARNEVRKCNFGSEKLSQLIAWHVQRVITDERYERRRWLSQGSRDKNGDWCQTSLTVSSASSP